MMLNSVTGTNHSLTSEARSSCIGPIATLGGGAVAGFCKPVSCTGPKQRETFKRLEHSGVSMLLRRRASATRVRMAFTDCVRRPRSEFDASTNSHSTRRLQWRWLARLIGPWLCLAPSVIAGHVNSIPLVCPNEFWRPRGRLGHWSCFRFGFIIFPPVTSLLFCKI